MIRKISLGAAAVALASTALVACNRTESAKPAADTGQIASAVKADAAQRIADVNAHDATKVASHYAPDAVSMFHGRANRSGPADIQAGFTQTLADSPGLKVTLSDPSVDVAASGDLAVYRATTTATSTDPKTKKPFTTTSNSLSEYKRQADGSWKVEWSLVSDTAPAPVSAPPPKG